MFLFLSATVFGIVSMSFFTLFFHKRETYTGDVFTIVCGHFEEDDKGTFLQKNALVIWFRAVTTSLQNEIKAGQERAIKETRRYLQVWISFWAPDMLGLSGKVTEAHCVP